MSRWLFFGFFYNHFMHEICCDLSVLVVTSCVYSLHWSILGLTRFMLAVCTSNPPAIVNNAGWSGSRVALGNCQEGGEGLAAHSLAAHLNSCPPVPSSRPTAHHLRPTNAHQPPTKFKPGTPGTRAHGQNTAADDFLWNERLVWRKSEDHLPGISIRKHVDTCFNFGLEDDFGRTGGWPWNRWMTQGTWPQIWNGIHKKNQQCDWSERFIPMF